MCVRYTVQRATRRWSMTMFYGMINIAAVNALVKNTHDQFPIPVIPITNRYNSLYNLQNDTEFLSDIPNYHTEGHNIKKNPTLNQRKARRTPTRKQRKILLIGDSHMRGCASELGKYLGPEYRVSGTFMPGARLQNITKLAMNEIAGFSKEDTVIIWGGSNDVNRNESMKGLVKLNEFVDQKNNTNIMIVNIPHRHDLLATSSINKEVENFNKKLQKIMKHKDNLRILNHKPAKEDFTQQGLHLNATDKTKIAKLMSQNLSPLTANKRKLLITLEWITTPQNVNMVNNIPEAPSEEYVVMGNERRNEDQIDSTIKGMETASPVDTISNIMNDKQAPTINKERNEDQMDGDNQGIRTSTRPKRFPNTRSDDFLWI